MIESRSSSNGKPTQTEVVDPDQANYMDAVAGQKKGCGRFLLAFRRFDISQNEDADEHLDLNAMRTARPSLLGKLIKRS